MLIAVPVYVWFPDLQSAVECCGGIQAEREAKRQRLKEEQVSSVRRCLYTVVAPLANKLH
jgi:hypothetical protein